MTALQKNKFKELLTRQIIKYNGLYKSLIYRPAKVEGLSSGDYLTSIAHKHPIDKWVEILVDKAILPTDEKKCLVESASIERLRNWWKEKLEEGK